MARTKKPGAMRTADKAVGFGWVGRWADGTIGWRVPEHVTGFQEVERPRATRFMRPTKKLTRCRITVEVLPDKRGRPVTRTAKVLGLCR